MTARLWQIDAFADRAFTGNPAAVCLLPRAVPDAWMQQLAEEMHLSETAFLLRIAPAEYGLRWFTPTTEVDLCGHATLASAWALGDATLVPHDTPIRFLTRSGVLTATRSTDGIIALDFPATPVDREGDTVTAALIRGLGTDQFEVIGRHDDILVLLPDAAALRALRPDMAALASLEARGIIVTCASDIEGVDFLSRFFGPAVGVPEDPVTGSAHCTLGPYWASRLGRPELVGHQASRRGGRVEVTVNGSRVTLRGRAVPVFRTTIPLP